MKGEHVISLHFSTKLQTEISMESFPPELLMLWLSALWALGGRG